MKKLSLLAAATAICLAPALALAGETPAPPGAEVYFINLKDGDKVTSPVLIQFGLSGMGIAPAGTEKEKTGHHHLIINEKIEGDELNEPIPADDPLFTAAEYGGYDIRQVTLREPSRGAGPLAARQRQIPPRLEGVRLGDRWVVIFSPYDISCALEKQNSMECTGYDRDDAEKIALNVLLYSLNH